MMKKLLLTLSFVVFSNIAFANTGEYPLMSAGVDIYDTSSLQNGAKLYVNYCMGCHSLEFIRYGRLAKDLQIPEDQLKGTLMFGDKKVGDSLSIAMQPKDGIKWFGVRPPDLSLETRARGADWVYTYLSTFYKDPSRPTGVNNLVFRDVGMPHVLWELEGGIKEPVYKTEKTESGETHQVIESLKLTGLSEEEAKKKQTEYQRSVRDLVNFLYYVGEPGLTARYDLGWKVIIFLALFFIIAYMLKREYWKDVH